MATLSSTAPTLIDLASRLDPGKKSIAPIVEMLSQRNPILEDMPWIEGNLATGNKTSVRTGLPTATWRKLYGYVQPSKSTTAMVEDDCAMLEAYAEIDPDLAKLAPDPAAFILSESRAHLEGMSQTMASALFYSNNASTPEQFLGLSPRFNSLSAENGENILNASGSGSDNASIWLIGWGEDTCFGTYPKGSKAGLNQEDLGKQVDTDSNGGKRTTLLQHFKWDTGLVVKDWRYIIRIANIDKSNLTSDASGSSANLPNLMYRALNKIESLQGVTPVFYMNRTVKQYLGEQTEAGVSNSTLKAQEVGGVMVETFHGVPVKRTDALAPDEAAVT